MIRRLRRFKRNVRRGRSNRRRERFDFAGLLFGWRDRLTAHTARAGRTLGKSSPFVLLAIIAALVPLVLTFGYRYVTTTPDFALRHVEVTGHQRVPIHEILQTGAIADAPNLLALDLDTVVERLERHPWILSAKVARHLPDRLEVAVTERKPVALVALGALYLVDERGTIFDRIQPGEHWDLPALTGLGLEDVGPEAQPERAKTAERLVRGAIKLVEMWKRSPIGEGVRISEITLDALFGYGLVLGAGSTAATGALVHLGHGEIAKKLTRLQAVLDDAERRGQRIAEIRLNDERDPSRVAVRFRETKQRPTGKDAGAEPEESKSNGQDRPVEPGRGKGSTRQLAEWNTL